jgi:biopolymer transport protein ExbD
MAIRAPGHRPTRYSRLLGDGGGKRSVVANLSLTAMVDMFTVLTIFLLQNYNSTGQVLDIPKEIKLPQASEVRELKPAHVVIVTPKEIRLDKKVVANLAKVKGQKEWLIWPLQQRLLRAIQEDKRKYKKGLDKALKKAVKVGQSTGQVDYRKITVQADKEIDFLTIKKVMYTITEAGLEEINFAVIKSSRFKKEI